MRREDILDLSTSLIVTTLMLLFLISPLPIDSIKVSNMYWGRGKFLDIVWETGPTSAS